MKNDPYRLYELDADEFQLLTSQICTEILGTGTVIFAPGKDGGKDGTFDGTANSYPSKTAPLKGKFIIQAKHTTSSDGSTGDSTFQSLWKKEIPKIQAFVKTQSCNNYLLFTNRRSTAKQKTELIKQITKLGVNHCGIFCREQITLHLKSNPKIVHACDLNKFKVPFRIDPQDIADVIHAFHSICIDSKNYGTLHNFDYLKIEKKNIKNILSIDYFEYLKEDSMPFFLQIREFLENPRNEDLRNQYHAIADEIKQKLLSFQDLYDTFEQAFTMLYDHLYEQDISLKPKRRLITVFLHYMYCDCDIGKK
jgi:hypothetical protein